MYDKTRLVRQPVAKREPRERRNDVVVERRARHDVNLLHLPSRAREEIIPVLHVGVGEPQLEVLRDDPLLDRLRVEGRSVVQSDVGAASKGVRSGVERRRGASVGIETSDG